MSRIKSLIHSIFVSSLKKYKKEDFNKDYFSTIKSYPDDKKASYYKSFFKPESALDVGCGVGNLVWGFSNCGIDAKGVDISKHAINRAPIEIKPLLKIDNILDLSFPDNGFDLVNCSDVLEHIPSAESAQVIQGLYRCTSQWLVLNICLWTEKNARGDPTHISLHSKRWWAKKISRLGYSILKTPDDFPSRRNAFIIRKNAIAGTH